MSTRKPFLYQGHDWSSSRWTVAEAYELLDRLSDLCLAPAWRESAVEAEQKEALRNLLSDLLDEGRLYLMNVFADTIAPQQRTPLPQHYLACFEADQLYLAMADRAYGLGAGESFDLPSFLQLLQRLRVSLKRMDA